MDHRGEQDRECTRWWQAQLRLRGFLQGSGTRGRTRERALDHEVEHVERPRACAARDREAPQAHRKLIPLALRHTEQGPKNLPRGAVVRNHDHVLIGEIGRAHV